MAELSPGAQNLAAIWGSIQAAIRDPQLRAQPGGVTQYVWNAYQQSYLSRGETPPPATIRDMNTLMSAAGRIAAAERNLAPALDTFRQQGIDQVLTGAMFAPDLDARSPAQQPFGPTLRVRYEVQALVDGQPETFFLTHSPGLDTPQTVSELLDQLAESAQTQLENDSPFGPDFGVEYQGLGDVVSITSF
jgi:hypothetical protein